MLKFYHFLGFVMDGVLRFILLLGVLVVGFALFLTIRLPYMPLSLDFAAPYFERQLRLSFSTYTFEIDDITLIATGNLRNVAVRIRDLKIRGTEGYEVNAHNILVIPSREAFLVGQQFVPKYLIIENINIVPLLAPTASEILPNSPQIKESASVVSAQTESIGNAGVRGIAQLLEFTNQLQNRSAGVSTIEYIRHVAVPHITITPNTTQSFDEKAHPPSSPSTVLAPSSLYMVADETNGNLKVNTNINYAFGDQFSSLKVHGNLTSTGSGQIEINIKNIRPDDLARFNPAFRPLSGIQLPINGNMKLVRDPKGDFESGDLSLAFEPGHVTIGGVDSAVERFALKLEADFRSRTIEIKQADFSVAGNHGSFNGDIAYAIDEVGRLTHLTSSMVGASVVIDMPIFFEVPIIPTAIVLKLVYEPPEQRLTIASLNIEIDEFELSFDGIIGFRTGEPVFDLRGDFPKMRFDQALALWPINGGRSARQWVVKNVSDGDILGGELKLTGALSKFLNGRTSGLVNEDFTLELAFEGVDIRFLKQMPSIMKSRGRMLIGARRYQAWLDAGEVKISPQASAEQIINVSDTWFRTYDYFGDERLATTQLTLSGTSASILRLVNLPPLYFLRKLDTLPKLIAGNMTGQAQLKFPLIKKATPGDVEYFVAVSSSNFGTTQSLGNFQFGNGNITGTIDRDGLEIYGMLDVNAVPFRGGWKQSFIGRGGVPPLAQISLSGIVREHDLIALNQAWLVGQVKGQAMVNILAEGPLIALDRYRFNIDFMDTLVKPDFLNYRKVVGVVSTFESTIKLDEVGRLNMFDFDYKAGSDHASGTVEIENNKLQMLDIPVVKLGENYDVKLNLIRTEGNRDHFLIEGKQIDFSNILGFFGEEGDVSADEIVIDSRPLYDDTDRSAIFDLRQSAPVDMVSERVVAPQKLAPQFEFNLLNAPFVLDLEVDDVYGVRGALLKEAFLHIDFDGQHLRDFDLRGHFADGSVLYGALERVSPSHARVTVDTKNAGALLRLIGLVPGAERGALSLIADIETREAYDVVNGRVRIDDFTLRELPVLLRILSVASLFGIAENLNTGGINFTRAETGFWFSNNRLDIRDAKITGPSLGIILNGAFNTANGAIDFDGTLIPAYAFNSLFSRIPLLGPLLGNRRDEGLVGVTFQLGNNVNDIEIGVNPLSAITFGFLRRVFSLRREFLNPDDDRPAFGGEDEDIYDYPYD